MSSYGVTKDGFVRKRYDVIYQEMQSDIKADTGIDISVNPQSYINVLVSSVADKLAALHEIAEAVYYAHYPSTADGDNLDYAVQLGGISREEAAATKYYILCTGDDGTVISADYRIATSTTPVTYFKPNAASQITRSSFNKATITFVDNDTKNDAAIDYEVYLDGATFYIKSSDDVDEDYTDNENGVALTVLKSLQEQITDAGYTATIDEDNLYLIIGVENEYDNAVLDMNENLTTASVSTVILFKSEELKKLKIAEGVITVIVSGVSGWTSCTNLATPIYGRERETDAELRMSYIEKQAYRSSSMISSITAAITSNVDNVVSAYGFENDTNETDSSGRPPHSIEIVVDGGTDALIAQQILYYKAAGIQTCSTTGNEVSVDVPTEYNHTVNIVFSRPATLYVWLFINIVKNPNEAMPNNYESLIKETIIEYTDDIVGGENIVLQKMIANIMSAVSGIAYLTINAYYSEDETDPAEPTQNDDGSWTYTDYTESYVSVTESQKASFDSDRIIIGITGS